MTKLRRLGSMLLRRHNVSLDVYLCDRVIDISPEQCIECIVHGPYDNDEHQHEYIVFEANITHNLSRMAREAGLYEACWHPHELLDPVVAAQIRDQEIANNYHGVGGVHALEAMLPRARARDITQLLHDGLVRLRTEPDRFRVHEPGNGWGSHDSFVTWVDKYLRACMMNPDAFIRVSR